MNDPRLDQHLESLRETYNPPGEPPTDLMWARIERSRQGTTSTSYRWLGWAAAVAAVLIIGIGLGRMSVSPPAAPEVVDVTPVLETQTSPATQPSPQPSPELLRIAAREFLRRTEVKLTQYQVDSVDPQAIDDWATDLLTQTRLFMATSLVEDIEMQMLLLDLEFVFAQIVEAAGDQDAQRQDHIARNLEQHDLMLRVRSSNPAATPRALAQEGRL